MIQEISAALVGIKTGANIIQTLLKIIKDDIAREKIRELNTIMIDLQETMLRIQTANLTLTNEKASLSEQIRNLKTVEAEKEAWEAIKAKYKLIDLGGTKVWVSITPIKEMTKPHYICPACYTNRKEAILQKKGKSAEGASLVCPICHESFIDRTDKIPYGPNQAPNWNPFDY